MHKILLTTALVIPFSLGTALAQDTAAPVEDQGGASTDLAADPTTTGTAPEAADTAAQADALATQMAASDKVVHEQTTTELRLDWITGASVHAPDGEKIGDITDLILDGTTGQMSAAIIGVGGFLGIGQKQIAVPWDRLTINYDAREVTSDLTRDEANAAPEYVFRAQETAPGIDPAAPAVEMTPATTPPAGAVPAEPVPPVEGGTDMPADTSAPTTTDPVDPAPAMEPAETETETSN
ncbi:MAG: PRC-barrel domain-containing protein [Paracoccus sp. (in: a-proteobacteria)]|uniref:PRC-barrel domain-containing protein n=1 Tax=Paracoccus sp. TaxID=267 RepID=UPI0026DEB634|nr:PRC-barrel domain-containing protein [Paracoccus sp. (in: a-proteobacteria)]MDO5631413.1 PRC-barrel domain-containing protein [Paracoccus sp. (in: a-proteobacteria)]